MDLYSFSGQLEILSVNKFNFDVILYADHSAN